MPGVSPAPLAVAGAIRKQPPPVHANLYFGLSGLTDPLIGSASPALASSFFAMFGTNA